MKRNSHLVLILFAAACGGVSGEAAERSSAMIGPEGGEVALAPWASVRIPPGALAESTEISLTALDAEEGYVGVGVELEPHGIHFATPVTLELAIDDDAFWASDTGGIVKVHDLAEYEGGPDETVNELFETERDPEARVVRAQLPSFSRYRIAGVTPRDLASTFSATWDRCDRRIDLEWAPVGATLVLARFSRQGLTSGWNLDYAERYLGPGHRGRYADRPHLPGANELAYQYRYEALVTAGAYARRISGTELNALEVLPPEPVEDLRSTPSGTGSVSVSWRHTRVIDSNADGYLIRRVPAWPAGSRDVGYATSYQDTEASAAGVHYTYYVSPYWTPTGCARQLIGTEVSTAIARPGALMGLQANYLGDGDVELSWDRVESATQYRVERGVDGAPLARVVEVSATGVVDPGRSAGEHSYRVTPFNQVGDGPSATVTLTIDASDPRTSECGDFRFRIVPDNGMDTATECAFGACADENFWYTATLEYPRNPTDAGAQVTIELRDLTSGASYPAFSFDGGPTTHDFTVTRNTGPASWPVSTRLTQGFLPPLREAEVIWQRVAYYEAGGMREVDTSACNASPLRVELTVDPAP